MMVSPVPSLKKYAPAPAPTSWRRKNVMNAAADMVGTAVVSPWSYESAVFGRPCGSEATCV